MKTTRVAVIAVIAVVALACSAAALCSAEHQPMSFQTMFREAKHVFAGKVVEVDFKDHEQEGMVAWTNRQYRISVNVTAVAKTRGLPDKEPMYHAHEEAEKDIRHVKENLPPHTGEGAVEHPEHVDDPLHDDETINVGDIVHVHFWRAISRPPGYKMPDAPGVLGMRKDILIDEDREYAFFGEYLNRDRVRRYMYAHTHPGVVRRRRHTAAAKKLSQSKSQSQAEAAETAEGGASSSQEQVEEFGFVNAYMAYIPDGITTDIDKALQSGAAASDARSKTDL